MAGKRISVVLAHGAWADGRMGAHIHAIDSDHTPIVTAPEKVVAALFEAVNS